jgi:iron complex outermembrane receptor protein
MLDKTRPDWYLNHHRTDSFTQQSSLQFPVVFLGRLTLGEEISQESINSTNLGKHRREHYSLFIQNEKNLFQNLTISVGNRYDHFDSFKDYFSPLFLAKYKLPKSELHFSASRSIRRPSFTELYYNDPTTEGDPGLCPEEALNYETGILYNFKDENQLGFNLFGRKEDDLIDWAKTNPADTKWKVRNIAEADVLGLDFYGNTNFKNTKLSFKYTFVNRKIKDKSGYFPKYGPISLKHYLDLGFDFNFFGQQKINFFFKKRPSRDGWLLTDLRFSRDIKNFELFVDVNNLFNVEYEEIEGIPSPGREIEAGIKVQW